MLPALRRMNSSPGSVWVSRFGSMRESEQVMNSASGFWPVDQPLEEPFVAGEDVLLKAMNAVD